MGIGKKEEQGIVQGEGTITIIKTVHEDRT